MMESEAEDEPYSTIPQLPLLPLPSSSSSSSSSSSLHSPDPPGMRTPPLYTLASVPFRWEEEPGKPRPCTALIPFPTNTEPKSLELPPCRHSLLLDLSKNTVYKTTPSPTTVLEGPYNNKFTSASFRFFKEECRQGSFESSTASCCTSPEKGQLCSKKLHKGRAFFGSWRQITPHKPCNGGGKIKRDVTASSSYMDASSFWSEKRVNITKIKRNGSFCTLSQPRPHFWVRSSFFILSSVCVCVRSNGVFNSTGCLVM